MDDWKKEYAIKFRKEQIDFKKVYEMINKSCQRIQDLFDSYLIDENIHFSDTQIVFPDCVITLKLNETKTKLDFSKVRIENTSLVLKQLSLTFRSGYYYLSISGSRNDSDKRFEEIDEQTIDYIFEQLLVG